MRAGRCVGESSSCVEKTLSHAAEDLGAELAFTCTAAEII